MSTIALVWRTSSYSGTNGGECVEIAFDDDKVLVRDTKFRRNPVNATEHQPQIEIRAGLWPEVCDLAVSMSSGVVGNALTVTIHADGAATFSGHDTDLFFTPDEMDAFAKGVIDGEFELR